MATQALTLTEYAELVTELAEGWDGEEPAVLTGDLTGSTEITASDGHTTLDNVGFAQRVFRGNGVEELMEADTRFFGTALVLQEHLSEDARANLFGDDDETE